MESPLAHVGPIMAAMRPVLSQSIHASVPSTDRSSSYRRKRLIPADLGLITAIS